VNIIKNIIKTHIIDYVVEHALNNMVRSIYTMKKPNATLGLIVDNKSIKGTLQFHDKNINHNRQQKTYLREPFVDMPDQAINEIDIYINMDEYQGLPYIQICMIECYKHFANELTDIRDKHIMPIRVRNIR